MLNREREKGEKAKRGQWVYSGKGIIISPAMTHRDRRVAQSVIISACQTLEKGKMTTCAVMIAFD
jgi:hypothetical protein